MKRVVVFDFDGTLTTKDTLIEFIKYIKGQKSFYIGLFICSPFLIAYKLKLYPNWKAKQRLFRYFFQGMLYNQFCNEGIGFKNVINKMLNPHAMNYLKFHKTQGDSIYIISASLAEWIKPWANEQQITNLLTTQIEVDNNGIITGNFSSRNCYGQEKVNRLLECEPERESYELIVYGDSIGDKEIIDFSDTGIWCK